jgi:hypothetical protein
LWEEGNKQNNGMHTKPKIISPGFLHKKNPQSQKSDDVNKTLKAKLKQKFIIPMLFKKKEQW